MSVNYEQAVEIVRNATQPGWSYGTYCLDDRKICETDTYFVFAVGAREDIIDRNPAFITAGGRVPVVYKADGQLGWLPEIVVGPNPDVRCRPNPNPTLVV